MSDAKLLEVVRFYYTGVLSRCHAVRLDKPSRKILVSCEIQDHLAWMCSQIIMGMVSGSKAHRWLGYIQGELRGMGLYSIAELREHSRTEDAEENQK